MARRLRGITVTIPAPGKLPGAILLPIGTEQMIYQNGRSTQVSTTLRALHEGTFKKEVPTTLRAL
jgi:hypothetical protein